VGKRRIRFAMIDFAKRIGAMRGGRPDWYRVAERLAEISKPELLKDGIMTRGALAGPKVMMTTFSQPKCIV
jgi:hypothetical protein